MNEFYRGVIHSMLTKALTGVSAFLVTNGWLSQDQTLQIIVGLAGLLASVVYSIWRRYGDALLKNAALQLTDPNATMNDAKALAKTHAVAPVTQAPDVAPKHVSTAEVRKLLVLLIAGSLAASTGCARANPNMSPERQVALYGTQVATYIGNAQDAAAQLHAGGVLNEAAYKRTLKVFIEVNKAGEQLGAALKVYDAAASVEDRNALVPQIDAALITLQTLLPNVLSEITDANGRAKVGALVGEVQKLLLTISRFTAPRTSHTSPVALPIAA